MLDMQYANEPARPYAAQPVGLTVKSTVPEADHKVALVVHLLGRRDAEGSLLTKDEEPVLCGWHTDRCAFFFPIWQQLCKGMWLKHIA